MACYAEARFYDPCSTWQCYLLAMNPQDQDEIVCILDGFDVELCNYSLKELFTKYNVEGECVMCDTEYKPRIAAQIFKTLNERKNPWNLKE